MEAFLSKRKDAINSLVLDVHKYLFEMSQSLTAILEETESSSKSLPQVKDFEITSPPAGILNSSQSQNQSSKGFFRGSFFLNAYHSQPKLDPLKSSGVQELAT